MQLWLQLRILGYGSNYEFYAAGEENEIDLSKIENKKLDEKLFKKGKNEFEFDFTSY